MKRFLSLTVVLMIAILVTGCPKKPTIVKEEAKAPAVDTKAQEEKARKEAEERAREAKARTEKEAEDRAKREAEEKARLEAEARAKAEAIKAFQAEDIHFDLDRYDIKGRDREILKFLAEWLLKNKDAKILIEGHCDDRGSNDYNLALGDRRAHSAKEYIVTLGISESRIKTISYGEEKHLCSESSEDCWWKNRRGHFILQ